MIKHIISLALILLTVSFTACQKSNQYRYLYLHNVTLDEEDVDDELFDEIAEQLSDCGLTVITTREEARALTPNDKLATMRVDIDMDHRKSKLDADLDIENYQNGRDLYETECKVSLDDDDYIQSALEELIDDALLWIKRNK